jgi:hypothetical protein
MDNQVVILLRADCPQWRRDSLEPFADIMFKFGDGVAMVVKDRDRLLPAPIGRNIKLMHARDGLLHLLCQLDVCFSSLSKSRIPRLHQFASDVAQVKSSPIPALHKMPGECAGNSRKVYQRKRHLDSANTQLSKNRRRSQTKRSKLQRRIKRPIPQK